MMNLFNNLRISAKLVIVFFIVIVLTAVLGAISVSKLSGVNNSAALTGWHLVPALGKANVIQTAVFRVRASQLMTLGGVNDKIIDDPYTYQQKNIAIALAAVKEIYDLMLTAEGQDVATVVQKRIDALSQLLETAFAHIRQGRESEGHDLLRNEITDAMIATVADLDKLNNYLSDRSAVMRDNTAQTYQSARIEISVLIGIIILVSILLGALVSRSISLPLQKALKVAQNVAKGDLNNHIVVTHKDETGQLMQALKEMNKNLRSMVSRVRSGALTIETASSEIATGNLDLSSRTEQQASSLEETASAMEELTSTVKQNADNARQANQLASSASEVAEQGGAIVKQVVSTMSSIDASSKKIVDIISVIDGIAFQTNILALNAAVEAARAGEQGRGFAVVASEVRNLAQRSAGAAKEIKALINDSVSKVGEGSELVEKAGSTMTEVVSSIKHVTDIVAEIAEAGAEQSAGIDQVNTAVSQMDEMMQQNAALVEQASAATQSLKQQVNALVDVVEQFKIDEKQQTESVVSHQSVPPATAPVVVSAAAAPKITADKNRRPALSASKPADQSVPVSPAKVVTPVAKKTPALPPDSGDDWEQF